MPIHDWTRVDAGLFHAFHHRWISALSDGLNTGVLPPDYYALPEQSIPVPVRDVLALRLSREVEEPSGTAPGLAVASVPPRASVVRRIEETSYARRADRIVVRHRHGQVVAAIEIVSPGNKASKVALHAFVKKTAAWIEQGVHVLVIDLFPPTKRDPYGIHKAIWDVFEDEEFVLPADKPLLIASYDASPHYVAYVEPIAVGDELPEMPLFLESGIYVPVPLEKTYQVSWECFPAALKHLLEPSQP